MPGQVWQRQSTVEIVDVLGDRSYRRRNAAAAAGLRGAMAFPALHDNEVIAVLEFYYREEARLNDRFRHTLTAIGYELGDFLARRRGQFEARTLTPREFEVLKLAASGQSAPQIAESLAICASTVTTHLKHAYEKLGVADRASAVATAIRLGLFD